jgi:hypothetical protein
MKIFFASLAPLRALLAFALCVPAFAEVTGTVINRTTGQPQVGATVALNKLGENGIELIDQAKSDAQGHFTINQPTAGPHVIRTAFDGVTYNHMLPPGTPATNLTIEVYNASKQPGAAKVVKHMLFFQPSGGQMVVNETYLYSNDGKTAWNNPEDGTLHFYLPAASGGKVTVEGTAPGGMPIPIAIDKTAKSDIYKVTEFAIKPGETRFDLTYSLPYTDGAPYEGKIVTKDDNTYLIAPNGVTLTGDGFNDLGQEPKTQAHIYGFAGSTYKIQLTGAAIASPDAAPEDSAPQIEQIMPRLYGKVIPFLVIALLLLATGFTLLYRKGHA